MNAFTRAGVLLTLCLALTALALGAQAAPLPKPPDSPLVRIQMANGGEILIKLYPKDAPKTVANFEKLVSQGFYNGLIFHRVTDLEGPPGSDHGHIVQGGSPDGNGMGGPGWTIPGEFTNNGFPNPLLHKVGAVAMARASDPNSAGCQFYICTTTVHSLDGNYAVFGQVIKGLDVASKIQQGDKMAKVTLIRQ